VLAETLSKFMPARRDVLQMSVALADQKRLAKFFASAGFKDVQVERETRSDVMESFEEYWEPIEREVGSQPQTYLALSAPDRRTVCEISPKLGTPSWFAAATSSLLSAAAQQLLPHLGQHVADLVE
jgi:hypothetical protein